MEEITIKSRDNYPLNVHVFKVKDEKAIIQIIHGMEEHQERYEDFIKVLNQNGFSVVSSDLRGHGSTCNDLGFFKEKNGDKELIEDQKQITSYIKNEFKNKPIFILAHSFGTIITRVLLQTNSKDYEKVVLSGYPNYQIGAYPGIIISNIIKMIHGPKYKSKLLSSISIGQFNKKIKNPKTEYDWVCKNEDAVKNYIEDPYCGIGFTCSAFHDLYHLVIKMHQVKNYQNVNNNLKLLLVRGKEDPCTGFEKGSKDSKNILKNAGFLSIKSIDYENMRHEILNEKENKKVYNDITQFYLEN